MITILFLDKMLRSLLETEHKILSEIINLIQEQTFLCPSDYDNDILTGSILQRKTLYECIGIGEYLTVLQNNKEEINELARLIISADKQESISKALLNQQQSNELKLLHVFKTSSLGVSIADKNNVIIDANQVFADTFGYDLDEIIGKPFTRFYDVENTANLKGVGGLLDKEIDNFELEKEYFKKNGDAFIGRMRVSLFKIDNEVFYLTCMEDVTKGTKLQGEIKEKEERYKALFNNSPAGIVVIDFAKKRAIDVNPGMIKLFGQDREALLNSSMVEQSPEFQPNGEKSAGKIEGILAEFRSTLKEVSFKWQFVKKHTGELFPAIVTFSPITLGGKVAAVMFVNDLSEQLEAERKISQQIVELDRKNRKLKHYINSNLELESFAYVASHDLREPLRSISGFTQLLLRKYGETFDDDAKEYMGHIVNSAKNMNDLIQDLLVYSRVTTEERDVVETDINKIVSDIIGLYLLQQKPTRAIFTMENLPLKLRCNKIKLRQVFQNLIGNAIKFRKAGTIPEIQIWCNEKNEEWEFIVKDEGIGIKDEYLEKIFLVFKRLHTRIEYEGSGIGLAICKKIVEQHGGEIWVESELGKGTAFHFTIKKNLLSLF